MKDSLMSVHVEKVWVYLLVFVSLLALTAVTAYVSFIDLGPLNNVVALGIAFIKALLVVVFFMHLRHSPRLVPLVAGAAVLWLVILFALTLSDYLTRGWLGVPGK